MSDANGGAGDPEATGTEPGESAEAPSPEEPQLYSDAPIGLAPPPGLPPSPGIRAPEITLPPGYSLEGSPGVTPPPAPDTGFDSPAPNGFASAFETPSVQAQATQHEQIEAQTQQHEQAQQQASAQADAQQQVQAQQQAHAQQAQQQFHQQWASAPANAATASASPTSPGSPARRTGLSRGAIIGIVAGSAAVLVVLIVLLSAVASIAGNRPGAEPAAAGDGSADTPEAAVESFLTALADGDAETAARLAAAESNEPLLTDEVLARSLELAPITGIAVESGEHDDSMRAVVNATFRIGDRTVHRDFTAWQASGDWELSDALVALPLPGLDGLEPTVNGAPAGIDRPLVFPGAYEIGLGGHAFELAVDDAPLDVLSVATSEDTTPLYSAEPRLTEARADEFRALVRASLEECLAMPQLSTPCGLDASETLDDGAVPVEGSAQRALTAEGDRALDALTPEPDYGDLRRVTTYDYVSVSTHIEADRGGELISGTLYSSGDLLQPYVDFSGDDPRVTWE